MRVVRSFSVRDATGMELRKTYVKGEKTIICFADQRSGISLASVCSTEYDVYCYNVGLFGLRQPRQSLQLFLHESGTFIRELSVV